MNRKQRVAELEGDTIDHLPCRRITMRHPDQDVEALMREVLEEGENPENFNWIIRQIVEPGELGIWQ